MRYDVTVRVEATNAADAIDVVTDSDFYYTPKLIIAAVPVKEEA